MLTKKEEKSLLATIEELGGKAFKEEDIVYEGRKLVVPEQWRGSLDKAIRFLQQKLAEDTENAIFSRQYKCRPWDGGVNAFRAMKRAFGMAVGKATMGFFGPNPPEYRHVQISPTETEEIPWGRFQVPLIEGANFYFGQYMDPEYGICFCIQVEAPRKQRFLIEGLFKLIQDEITGSSIYRGKAIDGKVQPDFIDLSAVDPSKVVYSEQVMADLEAYVWGVMRYGDAQAKLGMSLKRAILLEGTYGTGKTLAALLTAKVAVENGWTFIMARPGRDDFTQVMQTAKLLQPAVVFYEDADTLGQAEQDDTSISKVLDLFDGIQSKGTKMMIVLTTNHPEMLHKGMLRPGRIDSEIRIGHLDRVGVEKLIRAAIPAERLGDNVDFNAVYKACEGYVPAFVKEVADRSVRYSLARVKGDIAMVRIETDDLVHAAGGMRPQFDRMNEAPESATKEKSFSQQVEDAAEKAAKRSIVDLAASHDKARHDVWDKEKLAALNGELAH